MTRFVEKQHSLKHNYMKILNTKTRNNHYKQSMNQRDEKVEQKKDGDCKKSSETVTLVYRWQSSSSIQIAIDKNITCKI